MPFIPRHGLESNSRLVREWKHLPGQIVGTPAEALPSMYRAKLLFNLLGKVAGP